MSVRLYESNEFSFPPGFAESQIREILVIKGEKKIELSFSDLPDHTDQWSSDWIITVFRSSHPEVFWRKGVLKICSKFTGKHPCQSVISIKLLCNFIEITLRHGCSSVNLLHIFRASFPRNTSGWLLLRLID